MYQLDCFRQYAAIVFIVNNRFEIGKKKLAYLTFGDLVHCANEMIATWSNSAKGKSVVFIEHCLVYGCNPEQICL